MVTNGNEIYFKSRIKPDQRIVEVQQLIKEPEFIEKHPDVVENIVKDKNGKVRGYDG